MNFSIYITIFLNEYDTKVQEYCDENPYDVPDYNTLIDRIQDDLEKLGGVQKVVFSNMSCMSVYLTCDDFDEAKDEAEVVKEEIRQVFAKHGIE